MGLFFSFQSTKSQNPYSANAGNEEEPGPSYEPERARSTTRTESSVEVPPRALSIASLRQPTRY